MALSPPLAWTHRIYGWLRRGWEAPRAQRTVASVLLAIFVASLVLIELRRLGIVSMA